MKRRIVLKNVDQKLTAHDTVHRDSGSLILAESHLLLNDDEGAGLDLAHLKSCPDYLRDALLGEKCLLRSFLIRRKNEITEKVLSSQLLKSSPELRLENNNRRHNSDTERIRQQPCNGIQLKNHRHQSEKQQHDNTFEQRPRSGKLQPFYDLIDNSADNDNLHNICDTNR